MAALLVRVIFFLTDLILRLTDWLDPLPDHDRDQGHVLPDVDGDF